MVMACDSLRRARPLLGTIVELTAAGLPERDLDAAIEAAFVAVEKVHRLMSFHEPESDVSRLNREAASGPVSVDPWTFAVIEAATDLHRRSRGVFDVTVAPALQDLGLLPRLESSFSPPCDGSATSEAVETLPGDRIRFRRPGVRIDLGGIAKGFAVDRARQALQAHGATGGLVNAGGDLAAFGPRAMPVHIRDPREPHRLLAQVEVLNEALASSGARFDPFGSPAAMAPAVIDARTQQPARAVAGVTVRARSCMLADALTKVAMIAGEAASDLLDGFAASALLVLHTGEMRVSASWQVSRAA
jgi:thiamine biosynthesis lipoprotein